MRLRGISRGSRPTCLPCRQGGETGLTIIELLIVIAITVMLAASITPLYGNFQVSGQLNEEAAQIVQTLRTARERSVARVNGDSHGVKFSSNSYVLYQGASYADRSQGYDRVTVVSNALTITENLSNNKDEVVFSKGLGAASDVGTITLTHATGGTRTITVTSLGTAEE